MKEYFRFLMLGSALALILVSGCSQEEDVVEVADEQMPESDLVEYLFVQHSDTATLADGKLTLGGVGNSVLYFSDRPERIVGRESLQEFLDAWDEGESSFKTVPPNAVLTVVREDELIDLAVMLMDPRMADSNTLVYTVEVLEGPESGSAGFSALFIDSFGKRGGESKLGRPGKPGDPGGLRDGEPGRPGKPGDPGGLRGAEAGKPGAEVGVAGRHGRDGKRRFQGGSDLDRKL